MPNFILNNIAFIYIYNQFSSLYIAISKKKKTYIYTYNSTAHTLDISKKQLLVLTRKYKMGQCLTAVPNSYEREKERDGCCQWQSQRLKRQKEWERPWKEDKTCEKLLSFKQTPPFNFLSFLFLWDNNIVTSTIVEYLVLKKLKYFMLFIR